MRKLFAILTVMLYLHASGSTPGRAAMDSLMRQLDYVIEHRNDYAKKKRDNILRLKMQLKNAGNDEARFNALGHLFDEYLSYDTDSAYTYASRREILAQRMGNTQLIDNAKLNMAMLLSSTGDYTECLKIINSIPSARIPDYLRPYYYHIYRSTYGAMAEMSIRPSDKDTYNRLTNAYRDSLLIVNAGDPLYHTLVKADGYNADGEYRRSADIVHNYMQSHPLENHINAIFAYTLAQAHHGLKDSISEKYYLLQSALADLESGHREYIAPQKLAMMLYREGDLTRAYKLMRIALEDASRSNSRQRILEINEAFPMINEMYLEHQARIQHRLQISVIAIGGLLILLGISAVYLLMQVRRVRRAHRAVNEANERLEAINLALNTANASLSEANHVIAEQSYLKTEYIGHYMSMNRQNIEAQKAYRMRLRKMIVSGKTDTILKSLDSQKEIEQAFKDFYQEFDRTFLQLFPTFIAEFNTLLLPEYRFTPKSDEKLNTELRIYALIRLGITDSTRIAEFLGTSLSTVYNYRTRMRNRAAGAREDFDSKVTAIGKHQLLSNHDSQA